MLIQNWGDVFTQSLQSVWYGVANFVPGLIVALVVFAIGWILAALVERLVESIFKALKVDAALKRIEDAEAKREENRRDSAAAARIQSGQEYLLKHGYNADGIKKVEELMLSEGIASYAGGLALFERINPPPAPADAPAAPAPQQ